MTAAHREAWEMRQLDDHCSDDTYGESDYVRDRKIGIWRCRWTGRFVGKKKPKE